MKLTILGNTGPYPSKTGNCSGYLLTVNGKNLILDMGSGVLQNLDKCIGIDRIDAIFISHFHFDHTGDLLPLSYYNFKKENKTPIFAHIEDTDYCKLLLNTNQFNIVNIDENSKIDFAGCELTFEKMVHPVTDYAIKISGDETFVYTGDTVMNDRIIPFIQGADAVLADCLKPSCFTGPHMTIENAVELQEKTGVKIFATHYTPGENSRMYSGYNKIIPTVEMAEYTIQE